MFGRPPVSRPHRTAWPPPCASRRIARSARALAPILTALLAALGSAAFAQCPEAPPLQYFTGGGRVACPCFVAGEQAGVVFQAPPGDYPLEILRVGIGWGSQSGGNPNSLESAIHIYAGGLPNPGNPIFTLDGPVLVDGAINQFDFEPMLGEIVVNSGAFTVALEFQNDNAGNVFAPSVVNDGNGCQPGKNAVFAIPGGWTDACGLGVSGDWVFFVVYRPCSPTAVPAMPAAAGVRLLPASPNPFSGSTQLGFELPRAGGVVLTVHDLAGRSVARLADGEFPAGPYHLVWDGRSAGGGHVPSGVYFIELVADGDRLRRTVLVTR